MPSFTRPFFLLLSAILLLVCCQTSTHARIDDCGSVLCEYSYSNVCLQLGLGNVTQLWDDATVYTFAADEREYSDFKDVVRLAETLQSKKDVNCLDPTSSMCFMIFTNNVHSQSSWNAMHLSRWDTHLAPVFDGRSASTIDVFTYSPSHSALEEAADTLLFEKKE